MAVGDGDIRATDLLAKLPQGEYDDITCQLVKLLADKELSERNRRTKWEEFDVDELGRWMVQAHALDNDLREFAPYREDSGVGSDRDLIAEAQYLASKLATILAHLASKASREWHEAVTDEEAAKGK